MTPELIDSPVDLDSCRALLADRDRQITTLEGDVVSLRQRLNDALEACGTPPFTFDKPSQTPIDQEQVLGRGIRPLLLQSQNGVTAPKSGVTKRVWEISDEITRNRETGGFPATKGEVVVKATAEGIKETTAQAAYSSWCKFHSINAKDTSKPYVHKEPKSKVEIKVGEPTPIPDKELIHAEEPQSNDTPHACFSQPLPVFAPPPPLPVFLPPPPLPI